MHCRQATRQTLPYPTSYLKSKGLGKSCALITNGRFSGGSSGLCIDHISPEAAEAGAIALVEEGDTIQIDIPSRILRVNLSDAELAKRRAAMEARHPHPQSLAGPPGLRGPNHQRSSWSSAGCKPDSEVRLHLGNL